MDNKITFKPDIKKIGSKFNTEEIISSSSFVNGLINDTYLVRSKSRKYVLQKLHPIFKPSVLIDTDIITRYLLDNGLATPLLVRTKDGNLYFQDENNNCWRMLTYIPGRCYEKGVTSEQAFSAGLLVGRFHGILSGFDYKFKHKVKDFGNSKARITKFKRVLKEFEGTEKYKNLAELANEVLESWEKLDDNIDLLPDRIIHGDLKINNIRFSSAGKAICLLDLDTLGRYKTIMDFAGGARTWCNKSNEDDIENSKFEIKIFEAMLGGYLSMARFLSKEEIKMIPAAIEKVILVLTARFLTDAFEEAYFKLVTGQYPNLYEQNKTKALAQLSLYNDLVSKKKYLNKVVKDLL